MPFDTDGRSCQQTNHFDLPLLIFEDASEHPPIWPFVGKVFVFHPSARFAPMSATCPFPNRLEDGMVSRVKDRFADHMAVIERPSRICGLSATINSPAVRSRLSLIRVLILRRNVFTFFFDGVMKNLARFPCDICVSFAQGNQTLARYA